jgi:hypothetical protein
MDIKLVSPCGFYCGVCRHYLARAKGLLAVKNLKHGCKGCREQDKKCAAIKQHCVLIRQNQIGYCFECADFPCELLLKLEERHLRTDGISPINHLTEMKEIGVETWLHKRRDGWVCPECGGDLAVIGDRQCYDCGHKMDACCS